MKGTWRVARREYQAYLSTPWCYGVAVAFLALTGLTFFIVTDGTREATLRFWFPNLAFVSLVTMPVVTSRTFAEENRMRHLEVLLARPVSPVGLVVGKWLAVVALFLTFLAPSAVYVGFLSAWGSPDWPPMLTSYAGAVALAALFAALGTMTSVFTSNPVLAGLASFAVLVTLQLGSDSPVLSELSYVNPLDAFARGAPQLSDIVYFVTATGGAARCRRAVAGRPARRAPAGRGSRRRPPRLAVVASANWAILPGGHRPRRDRHRTVHPVQSVAGSAGQHRREDPRSPPSNRAARRWPATTRCSCGQFADEHDSIRYRVLDLERHQGEAIRLGDRQLRRGRRRGAVPPRDRRAHHRAEHRQRPPTPRPPAAPDGLHAHRTRRAVPRGHRPAWILRGQGGHGPQRHLDR